MCSCVYFFISLQQAKYHEDFERARGRGCTPGLDEPSMERYQRANQMIGEAGYNKGMHPPGMEMDRRPGGIIVGQCHSTLTKRVCMNRMRSLLFSVTAVYQQEKRHVTLTSSVHVRISTLFFGESLSGFQMKTQHISVSVVNKL